jgi:thiol-disulfide isomerase/thioredoxin
MHALAARQAQAAVARGAIAGRRYHHHAHARRAPLTPTVVASADRGGHGHGHHGGSTRGPTPPNPPAEQSRRGVSTKEPPRAPPSLADSASSSSPSLFGALSGLFPFGGAASKRAEQERAEQALAAVKIKPLASRLELEAELAACEAPGAPPLVVVASTAWCGPCKLMVEDLEEAAARRGGPLVLRLVKIDVEQEEGGLKQLASELGINKLPTLFFCGGKGAKAASVRTTGLLRRKVLDDVLDNRMSFLGTDLGKAVTY